MTAPVVVADFDFAGAKPTARDLIDATVARGAAFVSVLVIDGDDQTPDAHAGGRRVAKLGRLAAEAARQGVGLWLRLEDTLSIEDLGAALDVGKTTRADRLRDRFVVVVGTDRIGKRLRSVAPQFPSAYELPAEEGRNLARFLPPNLRRATADADDLVVPWGRIDGAKLASRIVPQLAQRGARLWVSRVPEDELAGARTIPAAGFVVRCAMSGPRLGG